MKHDEGTVTAPTRPEFHQAPQPCHIRPLINQFKQRPTPSHSLSVTETSSRGGKTKKSSHIKHPYFDQAGQSERQGRLEDGKAAGGENRVDLPI